LAFFFFLTTVRKKTTAAMIAIPINGPATAPAIQALDFFLVELLFLLDSDPLFPEVAVGASEVSVAVSVESPEVEVASSAVDEPAVKVSPASFSHCTYPPMTVHDVPASQ
jgi:hypothetical protein